MWLYRTNLWDGFVYQLAQPHSCFLQLAPKFAEIGKYRLPPIFQIKMFPHPHNRQRSSPCLVASDAAENEALNRLNSSPLARVLLLFNLLFVCCCSTHSQNDFPPTVSVLSLRELRGKRKSFQEKLCSAPRNFSLRLLLPPTNKSRGWSLKQLLMSRSSFKLSLIPGELINRSKVMFESRLMHQLYWLEFWNTSDFSVCGRLDMRTRAFFCSREMK